MTANDNKSGGGQGNALVSIEIDTMKKEVRPGKWLVSDLKTEIGVDPAKVLAEITAHGLLDLDDGDHIGVHEHQRFMSHARTGASS